MSSQVKTQKPPTGWKRLLFRSLIYLYKSGLGGLLGKRFLLLNHIGRKSGRLRQAVLEVVHYDEESQTYYVASGYGKKSDWYQNLQKQPDVTIQVGRQQMPVTAVFLPPEESGQRMVAYARRYPKAAKNLGQFLLGIQLGETEADYFVMGRDYIPVIGLTPRE